MKLIMAIISSDDARDALDRLTKAGFRATVISTTGGARATRRSLGTEDQGVDVVRQSCRDDPNGITRQR
jgi:uncharacterized protein YaaQ